MVESVRGLNENIVPVARPSRKTWVTPTIVKINAGSAENGFSLSRQDGVFTKS